VDVSDSAGGGDVTDAALPEEDGIDVASADSEDAAHDAQIADAEQDTDPGQPSPNNQFAAGQSYVLRFDAGSLSCSCPGVAQHDLLLTLHDDPVDGVTAWLDYEESSTGPVPAAKGVVAGQPLVLSSGSLGEVGYPSECAGWSVEVDTMTLQESAQGDDGLPDSLTGTMTGQYWETDGDYTFPTDLGGTLTGARDNEAPDVVLFTDGAWPELRLVASFDELVLTGSVEQALALTVDGVETTFSLEPALTGPAGYARQFEVAPAEPLHPGAEVLVALGPVADFAGNLAASPKPLSFQIPALPPVTVTADWDFSGGDPFVAKGKAQVVPSFGGIEAPTGGAMAVVDADYETGSLADPVAVVVQVPEGATKLRVTMAVLAQEPDKPVWYSPPREVALLVAPGTRKVSFPSEAAWEPGTTTVDGVTYLFSGFITLELDVADVAGEVGELRIGHPSTSEVSCFPEPFVSASEVHLVDNIAFE
jgi:hypothetical protein